MLQRWVERIAERELERITSKCRRYQEHGRPVLSWVRARMDECIRRVEQVEQEETGRWDVALLAVDEAGA